MSRLQANLLLLVAALIWGSSFVVQQIGVGSLNATSFTGSRFLLGSLIVFPFAFKQYKKRENSGQYHFTTFDWVGIAGIGVVLCTAAALQQYGILHTTVTKSGFLTALYVPIVPVLGFVALRKKPHWSVWPASIGCLLGTYVMSGAQNVQFAPGDFWVIASAFFWASHVLLVGFMVERTQSPLVVASGQFFVCGVCGLLLGELLEAPTMVDYSSALLGVLFMGFFSVGLAFTFQVIGQRYTPAPDAAIILSSETVFAAICGALFLGERFTMVQYSGAALIFVGIMAVEILPLMQRAKKLS